MDAGAPRRYASAEHLGPADQRTSQWHGRHHGPGDKWLPSSAMPTKWIGRPARCVPVITVAVAPQRTALGPMLARCWRCESLPTAPAVPREASLREAQRPGHHSAPAQRGAPVLSKYARHPRDPLRRLRRGSACQSACCCRHGSPMAAARTGCWRSDAPSLGTRSGSGTASAPPPSTGWLARRSCRHRDAVREPAEVLFLCRNPHRRRASPMQSLCHAPWPLRPAPPLHAQHARRRLRGDNLYRRTILTITRYARQNKKSQRRTYFFKI